jgi:hypothetical protein
MGEPAIRIDVIAALRKRPNVTQNERLGLMDRPLVA